MGDTTTATVTPTPAPTAEHGPITHAVHALARHLIDHQLGGLITIDTPTPCIDAPGQRHLTVGIHSWAIDSWLATVTFTSRTSEPIYPNGPAKGRFIRHRTLCLLPDSGVRVVLRHLERVA